MLARIPEFVMVPVATAPKWQLIKRPRTGGGVIDLRTNETIVTGLSMPHSPRVDRDPSLAGFFTGTDIGFDRFHDSWHTMSLRGASC